MDFILLGFLGIAMIMWLVSGYMMVQPKKIKAPEIITSPAPAIEPPSQNLIDEANRIGKYDMRKALKNYTKNKVYAFLLELEESFPDDDKVHELTEKVRSLYDQIVNWNDTRIAEMIHTYERMSMQILEFDPSVGQTSDKYLATDDSELFSAYIKGGMEFLDDVDTEKAKLLENQQRIEERKAGLKEINRRWSSANVELTKLRNKEIESVSSLEEFDRLLEEGM